MSGKDLIALIRGRAERLPPGAFKAAAAALGVDADALRAIWQVETAGKPFRPDGTVARRFEPHHFPAYKAAGWTFKDSLKARQSTLEAMFINAFADDPTAALRASSWGGPQVMGFNAQKVGYALTEDMVRAFADSEQAQLDVLVTIIRDWDLATALRAHDWTAFAARYNGKANVKAYAAKVEAAYRKLSGNASAVVLKAGDEGEAVRRLQLALGIVPDGHFGPSTLVAVERFQKSKGLRVDGVVGAVTWGALHVQTSVDPVRQETPVDARIELAERTARLGAVITGAVGSLRAALPDDVFSLTLYAAIGLATLYGALWVIRKARA